MDYDKAVSKYIELRDANKRMQDEVDAKIAENKEVMEKLSVWVELQAQNDKLETVVTKHGTVFWTLGDRCNLSNSGEFFNYCLEKQAWELIEKRANKTGVRDWINTHKEVPPGVNYVTFRQINVRAKK
jgi:hypothetical protein